MHKLMNYICDELYDLERKVEKEGRLSMSEIQYGDILAHFKKDLLTSDAMESGGSSYNGGYSGALKRDNMGRYTEDSNSNRYYDSEYSNGWYPERRYYDGGYSGRRYYSMDEGKSHLIHQIEKLMDNTSDQEERDALQSAVNRLKNR